MEAIIVAAFVVLIGIGIWGIYRNRRTHEPRRGGGGGWSPPPGKPDQPLPPRGDAPRQ